MAKYPPTPLWESFEVVLRGPDGKLDPKQKPFSKELASGDGDEIKTALQKMWLLQNHGWPTALAHLRDKQGKPLIARADDKDPEIWILKCKPKCWRLYFYVGRPRITYLYAKCKKKTAQDPGDSARARRIFNGIGGRGSGVAPFEFPSG